MPKQHITLIVVEVEGDLIVSWDHWLCWLRKWHETTNAFAESYALNRTTNVHIEPEYEERLSTNKQSCGHPLGSKLGEEELTNELVDNLAVSIGDDFDVLYTVAEFKSKAVKFVWAEEHDPTAIRCNKSVSEEQEQWIGLVEIWRERWEKDHCEEDPIICAEEEWFTEWVQSKALNNEKFYF